MPISIILKALSFFEAVLMFYFVTAPFSMVFININYVPFFLRKRLLHQLMQALKQNQ